MSLMFMFTLTCRQYTITHTCVTRRSWWDKGLEIPVWYGGSFGGQTEMIAYVWCRRRHNMYSYYVRYTDGWTDKLSWMFAFAPQSAHITLTPRAQTVLVFSPLFHPYALYTFCVPQLYIPIPTLSSSFREWVELIIKPLKLKSHLRKQSPLILLVQARMNTSFWRTFGWR